jgi:hypothetical protein
MIQLYGTSASVMLDVERYEYDLDPKYVENESYNGYVYRTRYRERKRFNFSAVVDEGSRDDIEAVDADNLITMYDEDGTEYEGYISNLRFERIAGADYYRTSFNFRGWEV